MKSSISPWHSLKTRVTFFTLVVFVLGIWALSFYASRLLQGDMQRQLSEQQFSTASFVAEKVNEHLIERLAALEGVARIVEPAILGNGMALQTFLTQRPTLQSLFNAGTYITDAHGTAQASLPLSVERVGVNYIEFEHLVTALKEGRPTISKPRMGKALLAPVVAMAVPIRNAQGQVAGALVGVIDLSKPSFLRAITDQRYGKTGGYVLISAQHRLVITATDKSRTMEQLPAVGVNAWVDRFIQGYEGSAIARNPKGVETLVSGKGIPAANWYVLTTLPTDEALAPIRDMQQHMVLATLVLTLLAGVLTWWMLKRALSPLLAAAYTLSRVPVTGQLSEPLPVVRQDEVGALVAGFNHLLQINQEREASLQASEAFKSIILNSLDAEIAVVDRHGVIVAVNDGWQKFALENGLKPGEPTPNTGVGSNYFDCLGSEITVDIGLMNVKDGLQGVLEGRLRSFDLDYPCDTPTQQRWFSMTIVPLGQGATSGAVVTHTDITQRKQAEAARQESEERFRTVVEVIPDAIVLHRGSKLVFVNPAAVAMFGAKSEQEILEKPMLELVHPDSQHVVRQRVIGGIEWGKAAPRIEECYVRLDGTAFSVEVEARPIVLAGTPAVIAAMRDITERKQSEESLRIAATAFESQQGMLITDAQRVILRVNQAFTQITGYSTEDAIGQTPRILKSDRHDNAFYASMTLALDNLGAWAGEIWNRRKSGDLYPGWLSISAVKDRTGLTTHFVAIFNDITERINAQSQIDTLAFYDPLTQLPNRRLLLDRLDQALHAGTRHARKNALLFVDLDNFKSLNDTLGHHQGDMLLMQVAQRLKTCLRDGDTVARLGSDEFVVMLENLSEDDIEAATQAETVASNVLKAFQLDFVLDQGAHHSTPSIGITLFGGDVLEGSEQPLKRAELAMFQAKAAGRNMLRFFDAKMQAEVSALAAMEADLREAVQQQQLLLHYQPQVVGAGRVIGVEALVRWQHPRRGMVSPAEFIPLAEENGLILPIGQWVLDAACIQLAAWAKQPHLAHLTMAVNVSARQFKQSDFVDSVLATLERTQANPKRLKLELTESMLVDNVEAIIAKMGSLKTIGISFSLDDFGTGYSSLAYLKRLPLDQLKIDQGFVRNIVTDPNDAVIAKMVVGLAQSMGLSVIAEGVELQAQADFLAHLGCHAYQGYLFGRPQPLDVFEAIVLRQ
jgi:diguanylate cyclase (GGDEF)-like protein/PAS domain S-box-containing protein